VRKIYAATWFPTFLLWAASHASIVLPTLLARLIGLSLPQAGGPDNMDPDSYEPGQQLPVYKGSDIAKAICVGGVALAMTALLVIPAQTALARVQASLLPADEDPLVPFDRSFAGRVEPEVVTGKGFATFGAAVKTVPFASWVRIFLLRAKIFVVQIAVYVLLGLFVALQILALNAFTGDKGSDGSDGQ
jgi:hypothetical protein